VVAPLSRGEFWQDELTGFRSPEVLGTEGDPLGAKRHAAQQRSQQFQPYDPGPEHLRGSVGQGQRIMNFDNPEVPLEHDVGGLIPVRELSDDAWDSSAWRYGGAQRMITQTDTNPTTEEGRWAHQVTDTWRSAPVETITPDMQVRTNQAEFLNEDREQTLPNKGRFQVDSIDHDMVEELRHEGDLAFQDPDTGAEEFPWVAEVENKRYLMEGHHRAISARTRDEGDFPAHVIRASNWGDFDRQMYDGPDPRR
jgi:hypothetical protein